MMIRYIALLFLLVISTMINADQAIRRLRYALDSDVTGLLADSIIDYELTQIDSSAPRSTLEIETEEWVHNCCFQISTEGVLHINLARQKNYPKIVAYLRLRTPLNSIIVRGMGILRTTNPIRTNSLVLEVAGTAKARLEVDIASKLDIVVSGTGQILMSGLVKGKGSILLSGASEFDGRACRMKEIYANVMGVGDCYIMAEEAIDVDISGVGAVYYNGPLRSHRVVGLGSVRRLVGVNERGWKSSTTISKSINFYLVLFSILYIRLIDVLFVNCSS